MRAIKLTSKNPQVANSRSIHPNDQTSLRSSYLKNVKNHCTFQGGNNINFSKNHTEFTKPLHYQVTTTYQQSIKNSVRMYKSNKNIVKIVKTG